MRVAVVGAGVVGLSLAWRLSERGVDTTVLDKGLAGSGTSSLSFAWVNANGKEPAEYYELNLAGMREHRVIAERDGAWLAVEGNIEIASTPEHADRLTSRMTRMQELGYPCEWISKERALGLEPNLRAVSEAQRIAFFPTEGHCDMSRFLTRLRSLAEGAGASIREHTEVAVIDRRPGGVRLGLSSGEVLDYDTVALCAGRWTRRLTSQLGLSIPMIDDGLPGTAEVGMLAVTGLSSVGVERVVTTTNLNLRPYGSGRLMLQALDLDSRADPEHPPTPDSEIFQRFRERLAAALSNGSDVGIESIGVGRRSLPADGKTVAGWLADSAYVVATHSGVTLAPYLSRLVADEVLGGSRRELEPFRPGRFGNGVRRTAPPRLPGEQ